MTEIAKRDSGEIECLPCGTSFLSDQPDEVTCPLCGIRVKVLIHG